jgi:hypothetical protein
MVKRESEPSDKPQSLGNIYDSFTKRMFGQILVFVDFLIYYADQSFVSQIDLERIQPAPTHYIGAKGDERIVDLVFQCPLKHGDGSLMAVIVFEHQSTSLKKIPHKLLKYISAIWDAELKEGKKVLSAPYFIVLRTGKKPYRGVLPTVADVLPKGHDGKSLGKAVDIDYDVVDLPAWTFTDLVGSPVLRLALGMLHKMTGGAEDEFPEALLPLLEITDEEKQTELTKEMLDFADTVFKAHNRRLDQEMVSKAMKLVFHDKEKEQTMIKSIFDEKVDEGIAIGEARGKAEGEARGEAKGKIEAVMTVLRKKFKRVPKNVEKAVLGMSDSIALESLLEHALDSETLDEFVTALQ